MYLTAELAQRCKRNPRYSLRAFAKILGLSPSGLSMLLSGQRSLKSTTAKKIAERLGFSPQLTEEFLNSCSKINKKMICDHSRYQKISLETYEVIADWQHYAILSLTETKDFKPRLEWIAKRLGISRAETKLAVDRMVRLGILDIGIWKQVGGPIKVENEIASSATQRNQTQILEMAIESLKNDPFETRDMASMTLAIDPAHLPMAKEEMRKFRRYLSEKIESLGNQKEVYHLALQLYPVSKK